MVTFILILLLSPYLQTNLLVNTPCEISYKREIHNTRSTRIDLAPEYFFSFTHPKLKSFYKQNNFINAFCQLSKNNGILHLNMNVKLSSSVARENYGVISTENFISFHFIKGGHVELRCINGSKGDSNSEHNYTVYSISYELDKSHIRKLKKYEIDKVGIEWSSGYEEYEVFHVDALINQLNCLEKLGML